jgi:hypothetical protein
MCVNVVDFLQAMSLICFVNYVELIGPLALPLIGLGYLLLVLGFALTSIG